MFLIKLKNNKTFICDKDTTIFEAAKKSNIILEHSCLSSRCRSCVVKVLSGNTINKEVEQYQNKKLWIIVGARYQDDLFWEPNLKNLNIKYIPVLSRQVNDWNGAKGYVQDIVLKQQIDLENTRVYACGSNDMINSAKELFLKNNFKENNFFSDAFVQTN